MLIETRMTNIVNLVNEKGSISVAELMNIFDSSESTIRRDLTTLHNNGLLIKVHGGAIAKNTSVSTKDDDFVIRREVNRESKAGIAKYAASLIKTNDFIYLDAGTTTELMIDYINERNITVVTNGIGHAKKLALLGIKLYLLGGELKASTEAIVGEQAINSLLNYNFTKGFFGANGITVEEGFTTPEIKEAMLKQHAIKHCNEKFVLSDNTKFGRISSVTFGKFEEAKIITAQMSDNRYVKYSNVINLR